MTSSFSHNILLSIFKRKGGEGSKTKIVESNDSLRVLEIESNFIEDEKVILVCYFDQLNYSLFTNKRVLGFLGGIAINIDYGDIVDVRPAFQEEYKKAVINQEKFSMLKVFMKDGKEYILNVEEGKPYKGIYQMLYFIRNKE